MSHPRQLRCVMAQLNLVVGAVEGNTSRIIAAANQARDQSGADVVMLPELAVSGYPPEDLLFHSGMRTQVARSIQRLKTEVRGITLIAGYPEYDGARIFNSAIVIRDGAVLANHRKACLPNYRVFDEKRYFTPGTETTVVELNGIKSGILVCEDVWDAEPARRARRAGAQVLLVINASPYEVDKQRQRERQVGAVRVGETGIPLVFVNLIGGQDELVFDGNSFVMDAAGEVTMRAPAFTEGLYVVDLALDAGGAVTPVPAAIVPLQGQEESVYGALVQGTRDYVDKHRFPGAVLGLSGGVDSALTLCIAVDALGAERVHSVAMPSRYTSQMSREDAAEQASWLRVKHSEISIEGMFEAALAALKEEFAGLPARCRRGEHSSALPRRAVDGHIEQDGPHAAHHRQQERNGRGLRDPVRRHGRRLCAHQGLQQAAGVPALRVAQRAIAGDPRTRHRAAALGGAAL